jgi:hypothetical protein
MVVLGIDLILFLSEAFSTTAVSSVFPNLITEIYRNMLY